MENSVLNQTTATKICSCCKKEKPLTEFCKDKRSSDGLNRLCRKCANEQVEASRARKRASSFPTPMNVPEGSELLDNIGPEYLGKPLLRKTSLSAYTPRELMAELKKRGFTGYLEWVPPPPKPRRVNLSDID